MIDEMNNQQSIQKDRPKTHLQEVQGYISPKILSISNKQWERRTGHRKGKHDQI